MAVALHFPAAPCRLPLATVPAKLLATPLPAYRGHGVASPPPLPASRRRRVSHPARVQHEKKYPSQNYTSIHSLAPPLNKTFLLLTPSASYTKSDTLGLPDGGPPTRFEMLEDPCPSSEGYRVVWYRSSEKWQHDERMRENKIQRARQDFQRSAARRFYTPSPDLGGQAGPDMLFLCGLRFVRAHVKEDA